MAVQPNEQLNIDQIQSTGFLPFFNSLPEKSPTTIRIFDRNDYYTVHGEDALYTAKEVYKTTGVIKYIGAGSNKIASVALNKNSFESWVRELLLVRQYRVEIFQNTGTSKNNKWVLSYKASPGNLSTFEEFLEGCGDRAKLVGVMAVCIAQVQKQKVVGMAYIDVAARKFMISEFVDNDYLSNLEAMVVQIGPCECIFPNEQNDHHEKVDQILKRSNVLSTERKKGEFSAKDIVQDLNRLLNLGSGVQTCLHLPEINKKIAMASLAALIKFLNLLEEAEDKKGKFKLSTYDSSLYVRLDASAIESLQLMPSRSDEKQPCLFNILNKCRTSHGQKLLTQWIKQPLKDINKIEVRQNLVEVFVSDVCLRKDLSDDRLRTMPDFQKIIARFLKKKATFQDCYRIYYSLLKLPRLLKTLELYSGEHSHLINDHFNCKLRDLLKDMSKFQEMIETTMDLDSVQNNEYLIKPEFDEELNELREKLNELENNMKSLLPDVSRDLGLKGDKAVKIESNAQQGFFFRVTLKEEKMLRGNKKYTIIDANKTGVRFHTKHMKAFNDEYIASKQEYEEKQKAVVDEVIKHAGTYLDLLLQLNDLLAEIDVYVSLAVAATAARIPYIKPKMFPKGTGAIHLVQARHPCLEIQSNISYIPNDSHFTKDKKFQIITGPNMGGKSTYMRTVGVVVLLAQIGSFVPCDSAEISIVDAILTRIGCEDNQLQAISTFMLEMLEMASILRNATEDSLLIIDELGRGTSTYDGFGLAWAISEEIAVGIKSYCMFATHFHELTELAEEVKTVFNSQVTVVINENGPTFLYQVKPGACDRSFGIHVAEMVHFPKKVLQFAEEKMRELEDFRAPYAESKASESRRDDCNADDSNENARIKKEGEQIMMDFVRQVKHLDIKNMNSDEIAKRIEHLKAEVLAKNNSYVEAILNGSRNQ